MDIFDQHGSGQPDSVPDLPPALLDPWARQVFMSEAISAEQAAARMIAIVVVASSAGELALLQETLGGSPSGRGFLAQNRAALFRRWFDYESGRWRPDTGAAARTLGLRVSKD